MKSLRVRVQKARAEIGKSFQHWAFIPYYQIITRKQDYLVYADVLENHNFWPFWPNSVTFQ